MSREAVEVVRRSYAAINRVIESGDIAPFLLEFYDPEIEYEPVEESSVVRGHEALAEYIRRWLDVWEEKQQLFLVADIPGSKMVRVREYLEREQALKAVGLPV